MYIVIIYFQNFIVLLYDKQYEITNKCTVLFYQTAFVLILGLSQKWLEGEQLECGVMTFRIKCMVI